MRPAQIPAEFPVPEGARSAADESDGDILRVSFISTKAIDLGSYFRRALTGAGWHFLEDGGGEEMTIEIEGHGYFGQIEIPVLEPGEPASFTVQLVR